ncbi:hotdog fold thioesterase [Paeniglutamicibacter antarcticus]|uniref:Hotdog fold thioesterase n=2 Tax=Arthrobacter terrae TaxID=2935737 RepID=A0A931G307_9MICC|nr:hotdog fold thioesterase [Arthrobacter terrae]
MTDNETTSPSRATGASEAGSAVPDTDQLWQIVLGELDQRMGVVILEQSAQRVVATMPVEGNRQSFGMLHGGASLAFGEAIGSWAAVIHASATGRTAVGVDVSATHHRSARSGLVTGVATAIHLGRTTTSHEVILYDEQERRLCTLRITNLILDRPNP